MTPEFQTSPQPPAARLSESLTVSFALRSPLPDFDRPFREVAWVFRHGEDRVGAALELLGGVCRWVAEVGEAAVPSVGLREWVTLGVIHPTRSDRAFRHEVERLVGVMPAFDEFDRRGDLDVDRPESLVNTSTPAAFLQLVLDVFPLRPVIAKVRQLRATEPGSVWPADWDRRE